MVHTPRQAAFMTTNVPRFGGTISWEQYRQVFDARVLSNGWDDATAALQLLSHLNVALLVPMSRRTSRTGLVDALSAHYGSPGRLADYRRQFEKTTRSAGEEPSIFPIALETLAVKAFGDMGQTAHLRLIRDRFIAGHSSCELYLDSVPPDSVPQVAMVTKPKSPPDQVEDLLKRLLTGMASPAPVPAPVPEVPMVEKLLQRLVAETRIRHACSRDSTRACGIGTFSKIVPLGAADVGAAASAGIHQTGLEWHFVFFMREGGS